MKKVIRLSESQLTDLIKKIVAENKKINEGGIHRVGQEDDTELGEGMFGKGLKRFAKNHRSHEDMGDSDDDFFDELENYDEQTDEEELGHMRRGLKGINRREKSLGESKRRKRITEMKDPAGCMACVQQAITNANIQGVAKDKLQKISEMMSKGTVPTQEELQSLLPNVSDVFAMGMLAMSLMTCGPKCMA